ncbi:SMI1/KNR4 family protein [Rhodopirellula bahusiensis]|uniref:SMI1/KNR4 family protein n=1 Tax=Rhodopirellula bahusiensis TaxID=2014065 RepID=UPI0032679587
MSVWSSEFDPPNPPLYDQLVADAQSLLDVQLPASYLDLLAEQNGGYIDDQLVAVPSDAVPDSLRGYVSDGYVTVGSIAGIGDTERFGNICHTPYFLREWSLPDRLVLLDGDGHSWVALDYRTADDDPPVVLIESDGGTNLVLAPNFAALLASFVTYDSVYDDNGQFLS